MENPPANNIRFVSVLPHEYTIRNFDICLCLFHANFMLHGLMLL